MQKKKKKLQSNNLLERKANLVDVELLTILAKKEKKGRKKEKKKERKKKGKKIKKNKRKK